MPSQDEQLGIPNPGGGGRRRGVFGRGTTNNIGNSMTFDIPGVTQLRKNVDELRASLEKFRSTVDTVGTYLRSRGQDSWNSPISKMTDQYRNLKVAIDDAVRSAEQSKGMLNMGGVGGGSTGGGGGMFAGGTPRVTGGGFTPTNDVGGKAVGIDTSGGGMAGALGQIPLIGGILGKGASGGIGGALGGIMGGSGGGGAAAAGGPAALAALAAGKAMQAGYNLFQDSRSASILMADILGPTATLAQTTIRQLIGTLSENMAAYGPITEQLSAINIGTQIGAGVPGASNISPSSGTLGGMIQKGMEQGFSLIFQGLSNAKGIITNPIDSLKGMFGGSGRSLKDIIAQGQAERQLNPSDLEKLDKFRLGFGSGFDRFSSPEATTAVTNRTGGFYQAVREMQAINPGQGAGQLAQTWASYLSDTGAQQRGMMLGQGAFTGFGQGGQIKSFTDWARAIMDFFKQQRPGSSRGSDFSYAELVAQNFPGSNINAWFAQMGVPQALVFYWWQYAISVASSKESDKPFDIEVDLSRQRGDDLAAQRLVTLSEMGRQDFTFSYGGGYSAALTAETVARTKARGENWVKRQLASIVDLPTGVGGISGTDLTGILQGLGGLGRAGGESVYKNQPVRTSELGAEVFIPKTDGHIMTASKVRRLDALLEGNSLTSGGDSYHFETTILMGNGGQPTIEAKRAATVLADHHENEIRKRRVRVSG